MDAALYAKMLADKSITDLKKLKHKYPDADLTEFVSLLRGSVYKTMPIFDFNGNELVFMENIMQVRMSSIKLLLTPQRSVEGYGVKAMENEIASTLAIEGIEFSMDSVRKIFKGYAPADESENRIYCMKKGLEFISDVDNKITEENIHTLYQLTINGFLEDDDKLLPGNLYRHDRVYIVGLEVEHTGLPHARLPLYMTRLVDFINEDHKMNELLKAAVIHYYFGYLHPYFDGNGRMARLIHMWYLVQQGYSSAMFIPFSSYIEKSRKGYYQAFTLAQENAKISGVMDVTPFLVYFIENIYNKMDSSMPKPATMEAFNLALEAGKITEKEKDLWNFVLSAYSNNEFSTKQLERDFGNAAYATIRGFVLKFEEMGLLFSQKYGNRVRYKIIP